MTSKWRVKWGPYLPLLSFLGDGCWQNRCFGVVNAERWNLVYITVSCVFAGWFRCRSLGRVGGMWGPISGRSLGVDGVMPSSGELALKRPPELP